MKKITTYIADDGKVFDNEHDCYEYEQEKKRKHIASVQSEMCRLDDKIWETFYPQDYPDTSNRKPYTAYIWLRNDIAHILLDTAFDTEEAKKKILSFFALSTYGMEILDEKQGWLSWKKIEENVALRSDFASALKNVKRGSDLSSALDYCFSDRDLRELATLHKAGKFRKKIEDLLTDCNFHSDCSQFINGNYEEYLL